MIIIVVIILMLIMYFDIEQDLRVAPIAGGAAARYFEQTDATDKNYKIEKYNQRYATGDLVINYPQHPYLSNGELYNWTGKKFAPNYAKTHWGQRKLLLSEIDLFNRFVPVEHYTVVYAGAADGRHMPILTTMYPNITLHLYDPRPFYPGIASDRILINPYAPDTAKVGWFTDEIAKYYKTVGGRWNGTSLVFVSDIRTEPTEAEIEANQRAQERWVRTMQPALSMLKFKLPYPDYKGAEYYKYMRGDIRLQCWAPVKSAETRLITRYEDIQRTGSYPSNLYERNCSWYNYVMRPHDFRKMKLTKFYYPVDYTVGEVFAPYVKAATPIGFDFLYEIQIICDYLRYAKKDITIENIRFYIDLFNDTIMDAGAKMDNYLKDKSSTYGISRNTYVKEPK